MRWIGLCLILFVAVACSQIDAGKGMVLTVAPSPDRLGTSIPTARPYPETETPVLLPNLRVLSARNTYVPMHCMVAGVSKHVFWIDINNNGYSPAPAFMVRVNGEDHRVDGLAIGETHKLEVLFDNNHQLAVEIDPLNDITEINETDNGFIGLIMTFTPAPRCTETPSPSPT